MTKKTTRCEIPFENIISDEAREHARAARKEMRKSVKALLPPKFVKHRRAARKEVLLAWRSMIDSAIEHTES
ncbi:MAG: hypothetical protein HN392_03445 [Anaerolineae bacterium]|jgi:hypothetical protein|nr:hypothetical protein [Anaerolineae bacterium]MBT7074739.1 hypothetical protein [Anaerolineae bacterium]MBT7783624.1 hypothetical protein [Anaerolineae bacterium]